MSIQSLQHKWRMDASRIPGTALAGLGNTSVEEELRRVFNLMALYYGEPWRRYHTLEHIESFENALDEMELCPVSVRIAGYWHDIIWVPGYDQAEERSAEMADKWLGSLGADKDFRDAVYALILATKHDGLCPKSISEAYMRDADLWTLGEPDKERFKVTQDNIRAEFAGVSNEVYKVRRQQFFSKMCKTAVYWAHPGKQREALAKSNLKSVGIIV